jgi:hypothetical protein
MFLNISADDGDDGKKKNKHENYHRTNLYGGTNFTI